MSRPRWTTASAPRSTGTRSSREKSASTHSPTGSSPRAFAPGSRRATPTMSLALGASALSRLVPMLPVAPMTTIRIRSFVPRRLALKQLANGGVTDLNRGQDQERREQPQMSPGVVSVSDEVKTESSVAQVEALRATVMELLERNRQLEEALTTRIVIEQAKGILAE